MVKKAPLSSETHGGTLMNSIRFFGAVLLALVAGEIVRADVGLPRQEFGRTKPYPLPPDMNSPYRPAYPYVIQQYPSVFWPQTYPQPYWRPYGYYPMSWQRYYVQPYYPYRAIPSPYLYRPMIWPPSVPPYGPGSSPGLPAPGAAPLKQSGPIGLGTPELPVDGEPGQTFEQAPALKSVSPL